MKSQPYTVNLSKVCRLCFVEKTDLSPIFDNSSIPDLSLKIKQCVSIEVSSGDQLPNRICNDCFLEIRNWINFKEKCTEADANLRNCVQSTDFKEGSGEDKKSVSAETRSNSIVQPAFVQNDTAEDNRTDPDLIDNITEDVSIEPNSTNQSISEETVDSSDKSLLYTCEICEETFTSSKDLFDHKMSCYLDSSNDSVIPSAVDEPENSSNESESYNTCESVDNEVQLSSQSSPHIRETDDGPNDNGNVNPASPNFVNVPDDNYDDAYNDLHHLNDNLMVSEVARELEVITNDNENDRSNAVLSFDQSLAHRVSKNDCENVNFSSRPLIHADIHHENVPCNLNGDFLTNHNLIVPESAADFVENPEAISHPYEPKMSKLMNEYTSSFDQPLSPICKVEIVDSIPPDDVIDSKNAVFINDFKPDRSNELFHEEVSSLDHQPYNGNNEVSNHSLNMMNYEYPLKNEIVTAEDFGQIFKNTEPNAINELANGTHHKLHDFYNKSSRTRRNAGGANKRRSIHSNNAACKTKDAEEISINVNVDSYRSQLLDGDRQNGRQRVRRNWRKPFYCDKCGKDFSTEKGLFLHNRKLPFCENSVRFKCNKCEYSTHHKIHLKYHLKTNHLEGTFHCETCGKSFSHAMGLRSHCRRAHLKANSKWKDNFICPYCKKSFLYKKALQAHIRIHTYINKCSQCDKKFSSDRALHLHERMHKSQSILKCERCDFSARSRVLINDHMLKEHDTVGSIRCEQCGESFKNKLSRDQHSKKAHSIVRCEQCGESFKTKISRDEHLLSVHLMAEKTHVHDISESLICDYCKNSFTTKAKLRSHIEWNHLIEECVCEICKKRFKNIPNLKQHQRLHHSHKELFTCEICDFKCDSRFRLQQHFGVHIGEKSYVCPVCNRNFSTKQSLEIHEIAHENDGHFVCFNCQKYFTSKEILKEHVKTHIAETVNGKSKIFVCEDCGRPHVNYLNLIAHQKIHTGELVCSHCQKRCSSKQRLRQHLDSHLSKNSLPCDVCHQSFNGKHALREHLKAHKNVDIPAKGQFTCEIRDFSCSLPDRLQNHLRTHVGEKLPVSSICNETVTLENDLENNAELYTCEICDTSYENAAKLEDHFGIHTGENTCKICNETFDQKRALLDHIRIHKENENTSKKLFTCEICDHSCKDTTELNEHFRIHTGEKKQYACDICFKNFHSSARLLSHKRFHNTTKSVPDVSEPTETIVID